MVSSVILTPNASRLALHLSLIDRWKLTTSDQLYEMVPLGMAQPDTMLSASPILTPSRDITTSGHALHAGHRVIVIVSMTFTSFHSLEIALIIDNDPKVRGPDIVLPGHAELV